MPPAYGLSVCTETTRLAQLQKQIQALSREERENNAHRSQHKVGSEGELYRSNESDERNRRNRSLNWKAERTGPMIVACQ